MKQHLKFAGVLALITVGFIAFQLSGQVTNVYRVSDNTGMQNSYQSPLPTNVWFNGQLIIPWPWVTGVPNFLSNLNAITLSGDVTGTGTNAISVTLKTTGTAGTYTRVTFDASGRETSGDTPALATLYPTAVTNNDTRVGVLPLTAIAGLSNAWSMTMTNFTPVINTVYSNGYNRILSLNVAYASVPTGAGILGYCGIGVEIANSATNYSTTPTTIAVLAPPVDNNLVANVPVNGTYRFIKHNTGVGNDSTIGRLVITVN